MSETLTVSQLAAYFECTVKTVQNWMKKTNVKKVKRGEYPAVETIRAFRRIEIEEMLKAANKIPTDIKETQAEKEKEALGLLKVKRQRQELELKKEKAHLHDTQTVLMAMGGLVNTTKKQLRNIPTQLAPELAKATDLLSIQKTVAAAIDNCLEELACYEFKLTNTLPATAQHNEAVDANS